MYVIKQAVIIAIIAYTLIFLKPWLWQKLLQKFLKLEHLK